MEGSKYYYFHFYEPQNKPNWNVLGNQTKDKSLHTNYIQGFHFFHVSQIPWALKKIGKRSPLTCKSCILKCFIVDPMRTPTATNFILILNTYQELSLSQQTVSRMSQIRVNFSFQDIINMPNLKIVNKFALNHWLCWNHAILDKLWNSNTTPNLGHINKGTTHFYHNLQVLIGM